MIAQFIETILIFLNLFMILRFLKINFNLKFIHSLLVSLNFLGILRLIFFYTNLNSILFNFIFFISFVITLLILNSIFPKFLTDFFKINFNFKKINKLDLLLFIPIIISSIFFLPTNYLSLMEDDLTYHLPLVREISSKNNLFDDIYSISNTTFSRTYHGFMLLCESVYSIFFNSILLKFIPLLFFILFIFLLKENLEYLKTKFLKKHSSLSDYLIILFVSTISFIFYQSNLFYVDLFMTINVLFSFNFINKFVDSNKNLENIDIFLIGLSFTSILLTKLNGIVFVLILGIYLLINMIRKKESFRNYLRLSLYFIFSSLFYFKNIFHYGSLSEVNTSNLNISLYEYFLEIIKPFFNNTGVILAKYIFIITLFVSIIVLILILIKSIYFKKNIFKKHSVFYLSLLMFLSSFLLTIIISYFSNQKLPMLVNNIMRYLIPFFVLALSFTLSFLFYKIKSRFLIHLFSVFLIILIIFNIAEYLRFNTNSFIYEKNSFLKVNPYIYFSEKINSKFNETNNLDRFNNRVFSNTDKFTFFVDNSWRILSYSVDGIIRDFGRICENNNVILLHSYSHFNNYYFDFIDIENNNIIDEFISDFDLSNYNYEIIGNLNEGFLYLDCQNKR